VAHAKGCDGVRSDCPGRLRVRPVHRQAEERLMYRPRLHVVALIPAHDEEEQIAATIA
jgi:hypothetical protein